MSQIHRVILLNKPLKIFDFTPLQLILMFTATILSFVIGSNIPGNWKINGLPVGFLIGMTIFCAALAFVKMSEFKPWPWWRNRILYPLKLIPTEFLPHLEPAQLYPDPTIMDVKKASDDYYVDAD
jgi:uncharacterized membrane protein required for colicin V production